MKQSITKEENNSKYQRNCIFTLNDPTAPRLNPALAMEIGLNESILYLQLEFWIAIANHEYDGHNWTYQSLTDLEAAFPFWSKSTLNRAILSLQEKGLIFVSYEYNKKKYDRTRWFAINLEAASKLKSISVKGYETQSNQNESAVTVQNGALSSQNGTGALQYEKSPSQNGTQSNQFGTRSAQNATTIPEITTNNSSKKSTKNTTNSSSESFYAAPNGDGEKVEKDDNKGKEIFIIVEKISSKLKKLVPTIPLKNNFQKAALRELAEFVFDGALSINEIVFCAERLRDSIEYSSVPVTPVHIQNHIGKIAPLYIHSDYLIDEQNYDLYEVDGIQSFENERLREEYLLREEYSLIDGNQNEYIKDESDDSMPF